MIAVLANKENVPFPDLAPRYNTPTTPPATTRRQDRNDALLAAKESARIARVKARAFALRLPTHIIRPKPESRHVAEENVAAVAPELAGAPLPYIRDKLVQEGRSMLASLSSMLGPSSTSTNCLPRSIDYTLPDSDAIAPSHVLALMPHRTEQPTAGPSKITLFPTHSLVLLSHCAALSSDNFILPEDSEMDGYSPSSIQLPTVPISLPAPSAFPLLHGYLYTKNLAGLLVSLLPINPSQFSLFQRPEAISSYLASNFTPSSLASMASRIHNLWANACALKVDDDNLWNALEMSWDIVGFALRRSTGDSSQ